MLENNGCEIGMEELDIFLSLRDQDALLGDMYDYIRNIELTLHGLVRTLLFVEFKKDWWRKGIPVNIRKDCVSRKEEDLEPVEEPYCYTTLTNLGVRFRPSTPL
jgi:hypothetical protein